MAALLAKPKLCIYLSNYNVSLTYLFGMAAMPFLCNGILLIQGNLPMVLPVIILLKFSHGESVTCMLPVSLVFHTKVTCILLFQCNLPRVVPVLSVKYASCLILYANVSPFLGDFRMSKMFR